VKQDTQALRISRKTLWAGRILSALPVLFLLVDGIMKLVKPEPVVKATVELGYPENVIMAIGVVLLGCVILYVVPRTAILGAILLTGYLGGAIATHAAIKKEHGYGAGVQTIFDCIDLGEGRSLPTER
jgi:formate-dependent nitrite reductase membrane component NrfD